MITLKDIKDMIERSYVKILAFDPVSVYGKKDRIQEQTASNCWIYSMLNNMYMNTGIYLSGEGFEGYLEGLGVNHTSGGSPVLSGEFICKYIDDDLKIYEIDLVKSGKSGRSWSHFNINSIRLFGQLLKKGLVFEYSRKSGKDILEDIKDNDIVNEIISKDNSNWHSVNLYREDGLIKEMGNWGDSIYNEFVYKNLFVFMRSIMNGTISSKVNFIYYGQSRPYTDYRNKRLGGRIDYDHAYGYQCVDLFKDYCHNVLGMSIGKTGNANEIWPDKYHVFDSTWTRIKGTENIMQGDIAISLVGKYGHIGVVDTVTKDGIVLLEQNGSGSSAVNGTNGDEIRLHEYKNSFFVGVWRSEKIKANYLAEVAYIANKIKTHGTDKDTMNYWKSTIRK